MLTPQRPKSKLSDPIGSDEHHAVFGFGFSVIKAFTAEQPAHEQGCLLACDMVERFPS